MEGDDGDALQDGLDEAAEVADKRAYRFVLPRCHIVRRIEMQDLGFLGPVSVTKVKMVPRRESRKAGAPQCRTATNPLEAFSRSF